jgi:phytoene synthase
MDLQPARFETWDELATYCYHVAGTVGLIAAPILGCRDEAALAHAVSLGIAMQLTNILRDVAEDARMGRLYLPLEELRAFGVEPAALLAGRPNGHFADLLGFEIARARALYRDAQRGVLALTPSGRLTVLASSRLYCTILTRIEEQGFDVFSQRAVVPTARKVRAMPGIAASFLRLSVAGG